jgi:hypothetical protein
VGVGVREWCGWGRGKEGAAAVLPMQTGHARCNFHADSDGGGGGGCLGRVKCPVDGAYVARHQRKVVGNGRLAGDVGARQVHLLNQHQPWTGVGEGDGGGPRSVYTAADRVPWYERGCGGGVGEGVWQQGDYYAAVAVVRGAGDQSQRRPARANQPQPKY